MADKGIKAVATIDLAQSAPTVGSGFIFENKITPSEQLAETQSMVEVNTEAAYRLPRRFSFGHLRKLASAKKDEAEDEICSYNSDLLLPIDALDLVQNLYFLP